MEVRRHYPDDRGRPGVGADRLSQNVGVTSVAVLPDVVSQNDCLRCMAGVILIDEPPPHQRLHADLREETGADEAPVEPLGTGVAIGDIDRA